MSWNIVLFFIQYLSLNHSIFLLVNQQQYVHKIRKLARIYLAKQATDYFLYSTILSGHFFRLNYINPQPSPLKKYPGVITTLGLI